MINAFDRTVVEITREGLFTLDSAIVHKAVFTVCLPYTYPPPYRFLRLSTCLSGFLPACLLRVCLSVRLSYVVA